MSDLLLFYLTLSVVALTLFLMALPAILEKRKKHK